MSGKKLSGIWKPLLAPKHLTEYSAEEYMEYVKSLHREPKKKEGAKAWTFRVSEKGTPILTIRGRKPKFLTPDEAEEVQKLTKWTDEAFVTFLIKKKVEVREREIKA